MNMMEALLEVSKDSNRHLAAKMKESNTGHHWSYNRSLWVYNGTWFDRWSDDYVMGFSKFVNTNEQLSVHRMHLVADWEIVPAPEDTQDELEEFKERLVYEKLKAKFQTA